MAAAQQIMSGYLALIAKIYATWDPAAQASAMILSNGNLTATGNGATGNFSGWATSPKSAGKFYWEITVVNGGYCVGVVVNTSSINTVVGQDASSVGWDIFGGVSYNAVVQATVATYTTGDILGLALNADARTLAFYKNNVLQYTFTIPFTGSLIAANTLTGARSQTANFGATALTYAPPAGFTAGLPA